MNHPSLTAALALLLISALPVRAISLVGEWEASKGGSCKQQQRYADDGRFSHVAGENVVSGRYRVSRIEGVKAVTLSFDADNGHPGCVEKSPDLTGHELTLYFRETSDGYAQFYWDSGLKSSAFTLRPSRSE